MRSALSRAARGGAVAGLVLLAALPASAQQQNIKIGIGYGLAFLPFYICNDLNLIEKHAKAAGLNIKATYQRHASSAAIQDAVLSIRRRNTSIYVLPGTYTERKWATSERSYYCSHLKTESTSPLPASEYIGSISSPDTGAEPAEADTADGETNPIALSYADQRRCHTNLNLISIFGDRTPGNTFTHAASLSPTTFSAISSASSLPSQVTKTTIVSVIGVYPSCVKNIYKDGEFS